MSAVWVWIAEEVCEGDGGEGVVVGEIVFEELHFGFFFIFFFFFSRIALQAGCRMWQTLESEEEVDGETGKYPVSLLTVVLD